MKYLYGNKEITTLDQWKKAFCSSYSGNDDDYHWQEGRSGESLAFDFLGENADGEETLFNLLSGFLKTKDVVLKEAYIEHGSEFDKYFRRRIQDLAITGTADGKSIFIGIEAKVDETFGSTTVSSQRRKVNRDKAEGKNTDADKRLDKLVADFLEGDEIKYGDIRYQLLYYLAGSFREEAEIIVMPVIVYKTRGKIFNKYDDVKGKKNQRDYKRFMESLGFSPVPEMIKDEIKMAYHKVVKAPDLHGQIVSKVVFSCYIIK